MVGRTFGEWKVLREVDPYVTPGGQTFLRFECQCSCGAVKWVTGSQLRQGKSKSCGCARQPPHASGASNGNWSANPTYSGAHQRIRRAKGPASDHACVDCEGGGSEWSYVGGCADERSTPSSYCWHPEHYVARCVSCHRRHDGNLPSRAGKPMFTTEGEGVVVALAQEGV